MNSYIYYCIVGNLGEFLEIAKYNTRQFKLITCTPSRTLCIQIAIFNQYQMRATLPHSMLAEVIPALRYFF